MVRTGLIAIIVGAVPARFWGGRARGPAATALVLWPSFGGHWVEVWFLNWLRPRLSIARSLQIAARVGVWFVAGIGLAIGMKLTAMALAGFRPARWPAWWIGGLAFVGIELAAHLVLQLRGRPGFYNGRG
jgi:hypothetical protein